MKVQNHFWKFRNQNQCQKVLVLLISGCPDPHYQCGFGSMRAIIMRIRIWSTEQCYRKVINIYLGRVSCASWRTGAGTGPWRSRRRPPSGLAKRGIRPPGPIGLLSRLRSEPDKVILLLLVTSCWMRIRIDLAVLDSNPYWKCGSGSEFGSMENDQN